MVVLVSFVIMRPFRRRDTLRLTMEGKTKTATRKHRSSGESEFDRFAGFMKRLVAVPHSEIKAKLDAEKKAKARKSS
jgi:hypothetical protein